MGIKGQIWILEGILCPIETNQPQNYRIRNVSPSKVFRNDLWVQPVSISVFISLIFAV